MKEPHRYYLAVVVAIFVLLGFFYISKAYAETADELKAKIDAKNSEIAGLEAEIQSYQNQIAEVSKQANSLTSSIKEIDLTRQKLLTDIKVTENKISAANLTIQDLQLQIVDKEGTIESHREVIAKGLRTINAFDNGSLVESILAQNTLADAWREVDSIQSLQSKVEERINMLRQVKSSLEGTKVSAEGVKKDLLDLKGELGDQKSIVDQNAAQKNTLLKQTKNTEANYQKVLADRQALKAAFEKEIEDYESQLKFILDPNSLPSGGVLAWPLDKIFVTQQFGITSASARLYATGSHNGTDFAASIGTPVKSMGNGRIIGTGNTDLACPRASFGNWILIQYDNGLSSTYGHLSLIKVNPGDVVTRGQVVGYSGNTGYSTGPHLHVSVYASAAVSVQSRASVACAGKTYTMPITAANGYLDPMFYLPKL